MSDRAVQLSDAVTQEKLSENADKFAKSLTELCRHYGIGFSGDALLFVFDEEDYTFEYRCDQNGRLILY